MSNLTLLIIIFMRVIYAAFCSAERRAECALMALSTGMAMVYFH